LTFGAIPHIEANLGTTGLQRDHQECGSRLSLRFEIRSEPIDGVALDPEDSSFDIEAELNLVANARHGRVDVQGVDTHRAGNLVAHWRNE
jgi:hypothetical protein